MSKRRADLPRSRRYLIAGVAAVVVVVALAIAWALIVPAADWLARHDVGSVTGPARTLRLQSARDAARGRLLTLGAGLFAAGALIFTATNYRLAQQGQVTDRYTKAVEQLGSDALDVRIGGIYALERVARDSARDHPTVMEVLTAFVREHSRISSRQPGPGVQTRRWFSYRRKAAGAESDQSPRADVQAALTAVGRRDSKHDIRPIDLSSAELTDAKLPLGAYLVEAKLARVNLTRVNLTRANFRDADLSGAILVDADLTHANLTGANLSRADLTHANLTGALWPAEDVVPKGWERDASGRLRPIAPAGTERNQTE